MATKFHRDYKPFLIAGTAAQKALYHEKEFRNILVGTANQQMSAHYDTSRCVNGLYYRFIVPCAVQQMGVAIQIVPLQDANNNWPSLTYTIKATLDGVNYQALPTAVSGTITNTPGTIHGLTYPYSGYAIEVTGSSNNGYFAVIASV
jgi:hypothetical protein